MIIFFLLALAPFSADKVEIVKENGESIVHLLGNVNIEDEQTKITCSQARFNETKNYAVLTKNIHIVDQQGEINADFATYDFNSKQGFLKENVFLVRKNETFSSDSLVYDGMKHHVEMFSSVVIEDTDSTLRAFGTYAWYDLEEEVGFLMDNPSLEILREERSPMFVQAQRFRLDNKMNLLYGFDSVVATIDSVVVTCDTFIYDVKAENGTMMKPVITEVNNQLIGKTGRFVMRDNDIESLSVYDGWSEYYTEKGTKNVVEGEEITILFDDGHATRIIVTGAPKGVVHMREGKADAGD